MKRFSEELSPQAGKLKRTPVFITKNDLSELLARVEVYVLLQVDDLGQDSGFGLSAFRN